MDPTMKGALIGAGATAAGGVIAWLGARSQAKAALQAVSDQARAQRLDGLWQMRRAAYADFLNSAEIVRSKIGFAYGHAVELRMHDNQRSGDLLVEARQQLLDATTDLFHQQALLGLSVTAAETRRAASLLSHMYGVTDDLDEWIAASGAGHANAEQLRLTLDGRIRDLKDLMDHFIDDSRSYLQTLHDVTPERTGCFERWWRRWSI